MGTVYGQLVVDRLQRGRMVGNVRVDETRDLFWFFDATRQAEVLGDAVVETVRLTLPRKIEYPRRQDWVKRRVEAVLDLPGANFDLMLGLLRQYGLGVSHARRA